MVNYTLGKIYQLTCNTTGLIYIGSSCERYLCQRLAVHTSGYRKWKQNSKSPYCSSFKILDGNNWTITLLEAVECADRDALACREGHFQKLAGILCVNANIAGRSPKQYYLDNIVSIRAHNNAYQKDYYQDNKNIIKQKQKERYKAKKLALKKSKFQTHMEEKLLSASIV